MRRKDWDRILDPDQYVYTKAMLDPYRPVTAKPLGSAPLHGEIRRCLLAGESVDSIELAGSYLTNEATVDRAIAYEEGRIAGEQHVLTLWLTSQLPIDWSDHASPPNTTPCRHPEETARIDELLQQIMLTQQFFTSDDVFALNDEKGHPPIKNKQILGPLLREAAEQKRICQKTGRHVTVKHHGRYAPIWESLIYTAQRYGCVA